MIPIADVRFGRAEQRLVAEVVRSGQVAQGPMVARLEAAFADVVGVAHAVAVSTGTAAIQLALEAAGIGAGDEVITSPLTFAATVEAILASGATARLVDVGDDGCLDPAAVAAAVGPRTAAILPVHLYGLPADMAALAALAERHGLAVVEDAAQALGGSFAGRSAGSFGIGCFSLYATKNLAAGEGGMVTTDQADLARRLRLLRNHGMDARYSYELVGGNHRMSDLHAALAVGGLDRFEAGQRRRSRNAAALTAGLAGTPGLTLPLVPPERVHAWHQYTVRLASGRDELAAHLLGDGVGSAVHYPSLVSDAPCYAEHPRVLADDCARARRWTQEALSLPVHPAVRRRDVDTIVAAVRRVLGG